MKNVKLTDEQKARLGPMLQMTFEAIAPDAMPLISNGRSRTAEIIELTCDANRPQMYGGMSKEDEALLYSAYSHRDTQKWLRKLLNY